MTCFSAPTFVVALLVIQEMAITPSLAFSLPRFTWHSATSGGGGGGGGGGEIPIPAGVCVEGQECLANFAAAADRSLLSLILPNVIDLFVVSQVLGIVTCGYATSIIKQHAIASLAKKHPENLGRLTVYDKMLNVVIAAICVSFLLDLFKIDVGPGLQSLFAAGGVGALVFGIASKDLAEQIVGGLVIATWDVFHVGDTVKLCESKMEGVVKRIGLVETEIEGYDNVVTKIPNSKVFKQRVSNLSRIKRAQVKQTLRFRYKDLPKIPPLLQDIKAEIKKRCSPELITDGTKPFRAHLYDYKEDHVQVIVNCHFDGIRAGTGKYMDRRQKVLEAIAYAVEKSDVEFAVPTIGYKNEDPSTGGGGGKLFGM